METQTNFNPDSDQPVSSQNASQKYKTIILIVAGITFLVIVAGILIGYFALSPLKPKSLPTRQPTDTPQPAVTSYQSKTVTLSPTPPPATSSSQLSNDDSINTLQKELEGTSIDQFSQELEEINQDLNSL